MLELLGVIAIAAVAFWLGRKAKTEKNILNAGFRANDSGTDNFEGWFYETNSPQPVSAHLEIGYADANGNRTRRKIHVRQFDANNSKGLMLAHCHLREESRSFRYDRVMTCTDLDTGEVVKDVRAHLASMHAKSPDRVIELLAGDYRDIIRVLTFLAMADGQFAAEEQQVIAEYMRRLTRDTRVTPKLVELASARVGQTTMRGFKSAVGRIANSGAVSPVLLAGCCLELAESDGAITPEEQEAIDYLDKRLLAAPV